MLLVKRHYKFPRRPFTMTNANGWLSSSRHCSIQMPLFQNARNPQDYRLLKIFQIKLTATAILVGTCHGTVLISKRNSSSF
eukprot:2954791-Amphidinium_carterae.1